MRTRVAWASEAARVDLDQSSLRMPLPSPRAGGGTLLLKVCLWACNLPYSTILYSRLFVVDNPRIVANPQKDLLLQDLHCTYSKQVNHTQSVWTLNPTPYTSTPGPGSIWALAQMILCIITWSRAGLPLEFQECHSRLISLNRRPSSRAHPPRPPPTPRLRLHRLPVLRDTLSFSASYFLYVQSIDI